MFVHNIASDNLLAFGFNLVVLLAVTISGLVLFASYLEDLLKSVLKDLTPLRDRGAEELSKTIDLVKVIVQLASSIVKIISFP